MRKNMDLLECVTDALYADLKCGGYIIRRSRVYETDSDIQFRISSSWKPVNENWFDTLKTHEYSLPISDVTIQGNTINVFLDRSKTFVKILPGVSLKIEKMVNCRSSVKMDDRNSERDLTDYRAFLLAQTIEKLSSVVSENIQEVSGSSVYVSSKLNFNNFMDSSQKSIVCGLVMNAAKNKKETRSVADIKLLKKEILMQKMEGRDKMNEELAPILADAVLKFDLLCVKMSKPVYLDASKSESGAAGSVVFIMYNYSRVNAILHEYESRVSRSSYPPLPPVQEVNFCVLRKKDEWKLLRNFIMCFPTIVRNTLKDIRVGKPAPHLLCQFLYSLARAFSSYYRSTKILLDGEPSLLRVTFARVHLIKVIHRIFYQGLQLLNIEALPIM